MECGWVKDVSDVLCRAKVFHGVVKVAEVAVSGRAALGAGKRDCSHDFRAALGQI